MPKKNNVKNIKTDTKTKNQKGGQNNNEGEKETSNENNTPVGNAEQSDETTNNNVPFVKVTTVKLNNTISKNAEVADREGWVGYLCTIM